MKAMKAPLSTRKVEKGSGIDNYLTVLYSELVI